MKWTVSVFLLVVLISCGAAQNEVATESNAENSITEDTVKVNTSPYCNAEVKVGAERTDQYLTLLENKRVAIVGNQSSMIGTVHLVDSLLASGVNVIKVFSPEHGFRGKADAGEKVSNEIDEKTGLPIISLYGKNKKPTAEQLEDVDLLVFDIQDVGARFYTYISTLTYVMEAAADNNKAMIVLDRPNPNGHYVAGPILEPQYKSFVGLHPVPIVHGMTIGEYAKMVDGEAWASAQLNDNLTVIPCEGWDHTKFYELPIAPSPNLPNMRSIYLYPSLCLFEGTIVSVGRGTDLPFQQIGHPDFEVDVLEDLNSFKPKPNEGASDPKLKGKTCYGYSFADLSLEELRSFGLNLNYLIEFHSKLKDKHPDFFLTSGFINNLVGTEKLRDRIRVGAAAEDFEEEWQHDLGLYKAMRKQYLLYPDFD